MDDSYSVRELDSKFQSHFEMDDQRFGEITEKLDDHFEAHTKVLGEILGQTTKTNGSVAAIKEWRAFATGAFYMLSGTVSLIILPIVGFVLWRVINIDNQIRETTRTAIIESLSEVLEDYEVNL